MPRGKDVGAAVKLGCPATTVVPRVMGNPPIVHIRKEMQKNLITTLYEARDQ